MPDYPEYKRNWKRSPEERFLAKVDKRRDGCWMWTGASTKGYGSFSLYGTHIAAHRFAYQHWVGPIPDGLHIDHLCNTPMCVNPEHMEPVTCEVNLKRGSGWAAKNALKTRCPQGHPYSGDNLRFTPSGARYCMECKRIKKRAWDAERRAAA